MPEPPAGFRLLRRLPAEAARPDEAGPFLRAVVATYYTDGARILEELSLVSRRDGRRANIYKRWDRRLAP